MFVCVSGVVCESTSVIVCDSEMSSALDQVACSKMKVSHRINNAVIHNLKSQRIMCNLGFCVKYP